MKQVSCIFGFAVWIGLTLIQSNSAAFKQASPSLNTTVFDPVGFQVIKKEVDCNFEVDLCGWSHSSDAPLTWIRNSYETPSDGTGPEYDHTHGKASEGFYYFLESSDPNKQNDTAALISADILPYNNGTMCFSFWYFMYGSDVGILQVKKVHNQPVTLFSKSGDQGEAWYQANITLTPPGPFIIWIEASVGAGYLGDIAIDDFVLSEGRCA